MNSARTVHICRVGPATIFGRGRRRIYVRNTHVVWKLRLQSGIPIAVGGVISLDGRKKAGIVVAPLAVVQAGVPLRPRVAAWRPRSSVARLCGSVHLDGLLHAHHVNLCRDALLNVIGRIDQDQYGSLCRNVRENDWIPVSVKV